MTKKKPESEKKKRGRRTVMTASIIDKLEHVFSIDGTDEEACLFAGISPRTLYNYQTANPDFLQRKTLLRYKLTLKSRDIIARKLKEDDFETAKWYLERKRKKEFSTKIEQEIVQIEPPVIIDNIE